MEETILMPDLYRLSYVAFDEETRALYESTIDDITYHEVKRMLLEETRIMVQCVILQMPVHRD